MSDETLPTWASDDLGELFELDARGPMHFRNRRGDPNAHGRAYGGQVLAQSLMAASRTVPAGRPASAQQFMFLQGTQYDRPIDFKVTALQDGKRFSSRHVRGMQGDDRIVFDAQVSFAVPVPGPSHEAQVDAAILAEKPESMPGLDDLPDLLAARIQRVLGFLQDVRPVLEFRMPESTSRMRFDLPAPSMRYWAKVGPRLADDVHLHAAAFAYVSDWWFNYCAVGAHLDEVAASDQKLYVASLNHSLWIHRPLRADEWLHFAAVSPNAAGGRGLSIGRVHDRSGCLVASVTQECLMASHALAQTSPTHGRANNVLMENPG